MLDVTVQEDFIVTGGSTLEKLDEYIRACDGVVHVIGKATGAAPEAFAVAALLGRYPDFVQRLPPLAPLPSPPQPVFSYTQGEAYLALYHHRPLFVYLPADFESVDLTVPRDPGFELVVAEFQSQRDHHQRICALGHDRGTAINEEWGHPRVSAALRATEFREFASRCSALASVTAMIETPRFSVSVSTPGQC